MGDAGGFDTKTYDLLQLIDAIREGKVRVPLFQRGFVWTDEDRRLLFDSIDSGYPIGTLLLARGPAPEGTLRLGGYVADVSASEDALWVVDGQQRLSTLAMSLLGGSAGAYRSIYFDLDKNRFVLGARRRTPPAHWVPAHVLVSSSSLNRWLRESKMSEEFSDRADKVAGRLRQYKVPAYLVPYRGPHDPVPREIFARVNRRGRSLKSNEVFDALYISTTGVKPVEGVESAIAVLGFGAIGRGVIERSAVAIASHTPQAIEKAVGDADVPALFSRVAASLSTAISFLAEEAGVPHAELMPYDGALPTLARFFAQFPSPGPRNIELLGRWFWRGVLGGDGVINNATDGKRWKAIRDDESASVQRLLALQSFDEKGFARSLGDYRPGTASTNLELCALCSLAPRVLVGDDDERGAEVPIGSLLMPSDDGRKERRFPLKVAEPSPGGRSSLAMYLAHGPVEATVEATARALREAAPTAELLATHGIDPVAWEAFVRGDSQTFLARRTERLTQHVRSFLVDRAGLAVADRDRPPLDSYFEDEGA